MAAFFLFISFMPCDNSVTSKITGKCYWTVNRFLKSPRDGSDLSLRAAKTTNPDHRISRKGDASTHFQYRNLYNLFYLNLISPIPFDLLPHQIKSTYLPPELEATGSRAKNQAKLLRMQHINPGKKRVDGTSIASSWLKQES